ncbi:hypothetical protein K458DRAFT_396950 [Lentithecium fluviatile CBS 122367]|uniref:Uncharacterized protein n=1 Tax=Lentithecium fluviatile CBS 122367 TaxID=1168545 RepID=A0A6G1IDT7_9PLEO|nr:hypothetical protein K458DRAFT_396950 [Lentithecium fluviatile CBS 122367]
MQHADSIWDPREYFLTVVQIRLKQAVKEWAHALGMQKNVRSSAKGFDEAMATFDRTLRALQLIEQLLPHLSDYSQTFDKFFSPDRNDIRYFCDLNSTSTPLQEKMQDFLLEMAHSREGFRDVQKRLEAVERGCHIVANMIRLNLMIESNRAAKLSRHNAKKITLVGVLAIILINTASAGTYWGGSQHVAAFLLTILGGFAAEYKRVLQVAPFAGKTEWWKRHMWTQFSATRKYQDLRLVVRHHFLQSPSAAKNLVKNASNLIS